MAKYYNASRSGGGRIPTIPSSRDYSNITEFLTQIGFRPLFGSDILCGYNDERLYLIDTHGCWEAQVLNDIDFINNLLDSGEFTNWEDFKEWLGTNYRVRYVDGIRLFIDV